MPCFFCGEDPQDRGRLYVNVDPMAAIAGLFTCHLCGKSGNLTTLKKHFGDPTTASDVDSHTRYEIFQAAATHFHDNLGDYEDALLYLRGPERGLTVDTIIKHRLGYAGPEAPVYRKLRDLGFAKKDILDTGLAYEREGRVVESFQHMVTIPYLVAGNVVTIRGRAWPFEKGDKRPKYKSLPGSETRLFNSDYTWHQRELFATEGEMDAMVLEQLGFPAVGIPGAASWQDAWDGYFSEARRVYAVFDRDAAGAKGLAKMEERFGSKVRALHLSPEGMKIDPTDWVASGHTADDLNALVDEANRTGGILVTVDEAVDEFAFVDSTPGLQFGVELLDGAISPGLRPSQLMIVLAKTGCLTGDTQVKVRVGTEHRVREMRLDEAYDYWGRHRRLSIQRCEGGQVRWVEIDEVWDSGVKPVFELTTRGGRSICATAEHPFYTPNGWRKLSELTVGDQVHVDTGPWGWRSSKNGWIGEDTVDVIRPAGSQQTYDISVLGDPHNFIANGFVVHNTGKTIMLLNFMQLMALQRGQEKLKFLFLSLEQTRGEWFDRARRLYRFHNLEHTDDDARDFWRDRLLIADQNRLTDQDVRQAIDDFDYRMGSPPDVICLDYLGYWARSFRGEEYQRLSDAIMSLKGLAKELRIPIIAPHQVNRGSKDGEQFASDAGRGCLAGDSEVMLADGSFRRIADMRGDETVVAPNDRFQVGDHACTAAWSQGIQPVLRVVTQSGLMMRATADHPFLTASGWCNLGDLKVGDRVATRPTPTFSDLSFPHAELLGHLLGRDSSRRHLSFRSEQCLVDSVKQLVKEFGMGPGLLGEWLKELGLHGVGDTGRFIPNALMAADESSVRACLAGLFSANGSVTRREVRFSSASLRLVSQVQALLAKLGVESRSGAGPRGTYRAVVRQPEAILRLAARVPLVGRKAVKLTRLAAAVGDDRLADLAASNLFMDQIESIEPDGEDEVFDITVPSAHCFIANGMVVSNSGVIEETADFVMGIWSGDNSLARAEEERNGLIQMQILKSRHGGRGQIIPFQFAPLSLAMVPTSDPLASLARAELDYASSVHRDTWEDALFRHRTGFKGRITSHEVGKQGTL